MSRLEQTLAEQEASRKRDHDAVMASHVAVMASNAAVMAALAAIRGLPSDQGAGDGGGPSKKRKENGA